LTREIVGWQLSLRCRAVEAIAVIEQAVLEQAILPGTLTLGTDNGSAFTARATRLIISALGLTHRRGGYRDPESQAFIESWFRYLKERCVWRHVGTRAHSSPWRLPRPREPALNDPVGAPDARRS
jgi:putative transposase